MSLLAPADGPPTERAVAHDMVKRGLWVTPVMLAFGVALGGRNGLASAAVAVALVCLNFLLAAALMTIGGRISLAALMGSVLGGYMLRLAGITGVIIALRHASWFHQLAFGAVLLITHLGLLVWETRYVSISLAYPGLKPKISKSRNNL